MYHMKYFNSQTWISDADFHSVLQQKPANVKNIVREDYCFIKFFCFVFHVKLFSNSIILSFDFKSDMSFFFFNKWKTVLFPVEFLVYLQQT